MTKIVKLITFSLALTLTTQSFAAPLLTLMPHPNDSSQAEVDMNSEENSPQNSPQNLPKISNMVSSVARHCLGLAYDWTDLSKIRTDYAEFIYDFDINEIDPRIDTHIVSINNLDYENSEAPEMEPFKDILNPASDYLSVEDVPYVSLLKEILKTSYLIHSVDVAIVDNTDMDYPVQGFLTTYYAFWPGKCKGLPIGLKYKALPNGSGKLPRLYTAPWHLSLGTQVATPGSMIFDYLLRKLDHSQSLHHVPTIQHHEMVMKR